MENPNIVIATPDNEQESSIFRQSEHIQQEKETIILKDEIKQHKKFVKEHTKNKELETKYHPISDRMSFWIDVYRGILAIQLTSA